MIRNKKELIPNYPYKLEIVERKNIKDTFKFEIIRKNLIMYYDNLSITDTIKFRNEEAKTKIVKKIRVRENTLIQIGSILEINKNLYEVVNIYSYINDNGFYEEDISLGEVK